MYISESEYLELQRQIRVLSQRMELMSRPRNFSEVCVKPYGYVRCTDTENLIFQPDQNTHDEAWRLMCQLGKCLHKDVSKFRRSRCSYGGKPYVGKDNSPRTPRVLSEMTDDQMILSTKMMNELIAIYNKYYQQANTHVLYADGFNCEYEEIPITYIGGETEC